MDSRLIAACTGTMTKKKKNDDDEGEMPVFGN